MWPNWNGGNSHYPLWNKNRWEVILEYYMEGFFKDKTVLDLGCGHGHFGLMCSAQGADVTFSDCRALHVHSQHLKKHNRIQHDVNVGWGPLGDYDIIINMGLLYHLQDPEAVLVECTKHCRHMILESEVVDSMEPSCKEPTLNQGKLADQGVGETVYTPSIGLVEEALMSNAWAFVRMDVPKLNSGPHVYDWPVENTGDFRVGLRKLWFGVGCRL